MRRFLVILMVCTLPVGAVTFAGFSQLTTVVANCAPVLLHPKQNAAKLKAELARLKKKKAKKT